MKTSERVSEHRMYSGLSDPILLLGVIPFSAAIGALMLMGMLWLLAWPNIWLAPLITILFLIKIIRMHQEDRHAWGILRIWMGQKKTTAWNHIVTYVA